MNEIMSQLNRVQKIASAVGVLSLVVTGVAAAFNPRAFFISYLVAFILWFGCFIVAMMHYLGGGRWGNVTRRFFEAGFMTLPFMAIAFIPIFFGLSEVYAWARPAAVAADKILQHKAVYENFTGFFVRAIFFFALWITVAMHLRKWSLQQDATTEFSPTIKLRKLSGPAIVIVPLTATFAFVDWIMSIEPAWFSTVFSVVILSGEVLIALAFAIMMLAWFQPHPPFQEAATEDRFLELGNFLLAFVMFWTYVAFSQFLIVYSGNLPHEIGWYLHRIAGDWKWLVCFIALFHFLIPFFVLLFRSVKRNTQRLAAVAILIFLVNAVEIFWAIAPTFYPSGIKIHSTDFFAWFGIGGIWLAVFAGNLKRHLLLAKNIPEAGTLLGQLINAK
jgi:hypothetical protein